MPGYWGLEIPISKVGVANPRPAALVDYISRLIGVLTTFSYGQKFRSNTIKLLVR